MIVVVGSPIAEPAGENVEAGGLAARVALGAARAGAAVEVVGRVGEDAAGDQVLLSFAAGGVGHVAVLREAGQLTPAVAPDLGESPSPDGPVLAATVLEDDDVDDMDHGRGLPPGLSVDAADVELALRYLPDYRVLVLAADLDPAATEAAVAAAGWSGAALVVLIASDGDTAVFPPSATILARPADDRDGAFAATVAAFAVALDRGVDPSEAFATAQRAAGWAAVAD